ncbi:hypothetical protein AB0D12_16705 [Streptomyces sp. NPDC048479]|uniref:hypothetical protein n=1 Tax=Streptomyces sp. NPDC048479 TaxID=3154725 RepID=UPI0034417402
MPDRETDVVHASFAQVGGAAPWTALADEDRDRLVELLGPLWVEVLGTGLLPGVTTLGIGKV